MFHFYNTIYCVAVIMCCLYVWCNATLQNYSTNKPLWVWKQKSHIISLGQIMLVLLGPTALICMFITLSCSSAYFPWKHFTLLHVYFSEEVYTFTENSLCLSYIQKTVKPCAHDAKCLPSESAGHHNHVVWPNKRLKKTLKNYTWPRKQNQQKCKL